MTFLLAHRHAYVRLGAGALLAGAAFTGTTTSAIGGPATACAKPPAPNWDYYEHCVDWVLTDKENGKISEGEAEKLMESCCVASGGEWVVESNGVGECFARTEDPAEGPQLPRLPDVGDATATLTPAPPPSPGPIAPSLPPVQTG